MEKSQKAGLACFFNDEEEDNGAKSETVLINDREETANADHSVNNPAKRKKAEMACFFNDEDEEAEAVSHETDIKNDANALNSTSDAGQQSSAVVTRQKTSVDVAAVLATLSKHLVNNAKFSKAGALFSKLIDSELCSSNSSLFFSTVSHLMCDCPDRDVTDKAFASTYLQIFNSINVKLNCFDSSDRYSLETFSLYAHTRNLMLTDDSFQFSNAVAVLKSHINLVRGEEVGLDEDQHIQRQRVLISCIETALANYKWGWAKPACDSLVLVSSQQRQKFLECLRDQLDDIVNSVVLLQRKLSSSSGPKTFRAFNSDSHPLRSKKRQFGEV